MTSSDKPDVIVEFANVTSYTDKSGGKYRHAASYLTHKRVKVAEIYMRLKTSKGRVSCCNLA
eukprot:9505523-Ditylum_brightwellii.AAC.1